MATKNSLAEVWQRGPIKAIPNLLQPVAHALLQAREEINLLLLNFDENLLWQKPAGLASIGFHLQHLSGVLDRIFTYARQEQLTAQQFVLLDEEKNPPQAFLNLQHLIARFNKQVDIALLQLQNTEVQNLTAVRIMGRKKIATTHIGLLVHAAEHTMRHVGQLLVTIKFVQYQNSKI